MAAILDVFLTDTFTQFEQIHNSQVNPIEHCFYPRLKFGFSLMTISVHTFLSFINKTQQRNKRYVYDYMDLNDINWERLIKNS